MPSAHKSVRIAKISILKLEGIIKKISYERRDYESVDENSLSEAMSRKTTKRRIQVLCKNNYISYSCTLLFLGIFYNFNVRNI